VVIARTATCLDHGACSSPYRCTHAPRQYSYLYDKAHSLPGLVRRTGSRTYDTACSSHRLGSVSHHRLERTGSSCPHDPQGMARTIQSHATEQPQYSITCHPQALNCQSRRCRCSPNRTPCIPCCKGSSCRGSGKTRARTTIHRFPHSTDDGHGTPGSGS
jgi:hypothetical protein